MRQKFLLQEGAEGLWQLLHITAHRPYYTALGLGNEECLQVGLSILWWGYFMGVRLQPR